MVTSRTFSNMKISPGHPPSHSMVSCAQAPSLTFYNAYVDTVFMPYIRRKLTAVHSVDIVWDVYKSSSLKSGTRTRRGSGLCWSGWHCPLSYQGIGKAACEWMRTRLSCFLCLLLFCFQDLLLYAGIVIMVEAWFGTSYAYLLYNGECHLWALSPTWINLNPSMYK